MNQDEWRILRDVLIQILKNQIAVMDELDANLRCDVDTKELIEFLEGDSND